MKSLRLSLLGALVAAGVTSAASADQIQLTGTLRDFKIDHSDFERANSSYPLITGMVKTTLGDNEKPTLNPPKSTSNAGSQAGSAAITVTFSNTVKSVTVTSTKDLSRVVLKFSDNSTQSHTNLSVGKTGTFNVSSGNLAKTLVGCFVRSGTNSSVGENGEYFTVANATTPAIPSIWRIESTASFNEWFTNVEGVNKSMPHTITLDNDSESTGGIYRYAASIHNGQSFFPLDGKLWGNETNNHNFHFTYEIKTRFTYTDPSGRDPMVFNFSGDDDVWVYINRQLVVDLGGVHSERFANVNVDTIAASIGLTPGETYDLHFFFAERHTVQSNFTLETSIQFLSPLYD